ncbi:DUF3467 domain-containing protein [Chloroflexota bacterium]
MNDKPKEEQPKPKGVQIEFPPHIRGGVYSNNLMVTHTKEEFIMNFIMVAPPTATVMSRVIMNPGHLKRVIAALQDSLKKYEDKFGKLEQAEEPKGPMGFGKN